MAKLTPIERHFASHIINYCYLMFEKFMQLHRTEFSELNEEEFNDKFIEKGPSNIIEVLLAILGPIMDQLDEVEDYCHPVGYAMARMVLKKLKKENRIFELQESK